MTKWEYRTTYFFVEEGEALDVPLNDYGSDGWELVYMLRTDREFGTYHLCTFRRPIANDALKSLAATMIKHGMGMPAEVPA